MTREILLDKINAFLTNQISKQEIYEWALVAAVSDESIIQNDPLIKATLKEMIEINYRDPAKFRGYKTLEYYGQCLAGKAEFVPQEHHQKPLSTSDSPVDPGDQLVPKPPTISEWIQFFKDWKYFKDAMLTARLYVLIFAVCSFVVQVSSLINPGFMQIGLVVPSRWKAFVDALPHLIYAYLILLPPRRLVKEGYFLLTLPLLVLGMIYYWKLSFLIVIKLSLDWIFILAILPFSAIPATLALLLVLAEKTGFAKPKAN